MDESLVGWMMSGRTPFIEDGPEARDRMHRAALRVTEPERERRGPGPDRPPDPVQPAAAGAGRDACLLRDGMTGVRGVPSGAPARSTPDPTHPGRTR